MELPLFPGQIPCTIPSNGDEDVLSVVERKLVLYSGSSDQDAALLEAQISVVFDKVQNWSSLLGKGTQLIGSYLKLMKQSHLAQHTFNQGWTS